MSTHRDAKTMAKALRAELARRGTTLKHGECLDIVARQLGLDNWNILTSRLNARPTPTAAERLIRPAGWHISGSKPQLYEIGIDPDMRHGSGHASLIRCRYAENDPAYAVMEQGFATLMQSVAADAYRGRRISLAADLRSEAVVGAATIWLRVDGGGRKGIAFDNMEERLIDGPLTETQGWSRRRVVIDVPQEAESLNFGFYLRGSGKAWAAGFDLREATADEASTERNRLHPGPTNLDFSEIRRTVAS